MAYGGRNFCVKHHKSFKHVGSLSYTEDDILIYTLYISAPLKKSDSNKLKKHFSKFGEVENVKIIMKRCNPSGDNNKTFSFAFVSFKEAESASKALRCEVHFFRDHILTVSCADSWKQPFQKKLQKADKENSENECSNTNYSILNLNDDCLFIIFKYLSFTDQIKMSTLCTRLEYIFQLTYKTTKTLFIDLEDSLTLMDFRQGLQKMGHHLENMAFNSGLSTKNPTRFIDFVSMFCPNLNKFQMDSLTFKYNETFRKISANLQKIRHLELQNCSINDEMINLISNITTIEYLDLTDNYEISGTHLYKFKNVKTLILSSCTNIQSSCFAKMCFKATNIKELNIRHCDNLNTHAFKSLVENLNELENLIMCTCYKPNDFEKIAEIKNLKHLTIYQSIDRIENLLSKLAKNKKNQLETLKITNFNCTDFEKNYITELTKLKQLDLPYATCTEGFIQDLSMLKELKILNIPGIAVSNDVILKYITNSSTIEFIDLSRIKHFDNNFIKNIIETLKKQNRFKPLTLRIKLEENSTEANKEEKSFLKENGNILKIDSDEPEYLFEMLDSDFCLLADGVDDDDSDFDSDIDFDDDFYNLYGYDSDYNEYDSDCIDGLDDAEIGLLAYYFRGALFSHRNC